jgi:hypothetical protein
MSENKELVDRVLSGKNKDKRADAAEILIKFLEENEEVIFTLSGDENERVSQRLRVDCNHRAQG